MNGIRDTSAQDRVIEHAGVWQRHRLVLVGAGAMMLLLALLAPSMLRAVAGDASVSRERLNIAVVERGDFVRDIAAEGRVVAAVSPTLYAPSAGSLHLAIHAGAAVTEDQVLGTLDSPELSSELAQERANLEALEVDYERAKLDARQQAIVAQETLEQARVDRETAATEHERTSKAFELGVMPEIEVLRTQAGLKKADIALQRAQTDFELQKEGRGFDVEAKRLERDRQQLQVNELQRRVDLLTLRAPVSGQIGQLMVVDRATVARDAPLLTVVDLSALEVEVRVPESFARDLAVGMPATVRGNGSVWAGRIGAVAPEVVGGEVTARVRFDGEAPQGLRQNQRLSVRVVLDERRNVLTVARGPFLEQGRGVEAYVVVDDSAEKRAIRAGVASIDRVEILEGLQAGERIVIAGSDRFNNAQRVVLTR